MLKVYYPRAGERVAELLAAELPESVSLDTSEEASGEDCESTYRILIEGRPTTEQLEASSKLEAVLIPFAGVPPETRERMAGYPKIALHNLHHNATPTAELALTLLLAAAKGIVPEDTQLRRGNWTSRYAGPNGRQLSGGKALVVGYGEIGRRIATGLLGLGMEVTATKRRIDQAVDDDGVMVYPSTDLQALLPEQDVLMLAAPLTQETTGMIGAQELALCSPGLVLVNIGRAKLIDEAALYHALESRSIHGAGLDVWYRYPASKEARNNCLPSVYPFHQLQNVVMTPHRAGHVTDTDRARAQHLAESLKQLVENGSLPHRVDLELGY